MKEKTSQGACRYCGFDLRDYETPPTAMPVGSRLGHYQVGIMLRRSRQSQCYIGIDSKTKKRVLIEEFFPSPVLGRCSGQPVTAIVGERSHFERAKEQFSAPKARKDGADVVLENGTAYRVTRLKKDIGLAEQAESILDRPIEFSEDSEKGRLSINALPIPPIPPLSAGKGRRSEAGLFTRMTQGLRKDAPEYRLEAAVISHMGCVRKNNEDNFFFDGDFMPLDQVNAGAHIGLESSKDAHLFAISDGMGGLELGEHAAFEVVSRMGALSKKIRRQKPADAIQEFAFKTSMAIQKNVLRGKGTREGATMALVYFAAGKACVANVGDSRVYLLRNEKLMLLSLDHSEVFSKVLAGTLTLEQARNHPRNNMINRYLGMRTHMPQMASVREIEVCKGDRFLICSDGLSDLIEHQKMGALLFGGTPEEAARRLVERALVLGGKDNTTVIVADCDGPFPRPEERKEELDIVHLSREATTGK
ncbi:MAG: protein phosphatase 2C domain-containing protein [Clostridia bacterium]|nr:protein phosphatase 2C domain-containing protein [Clostridia bacterium]